MPELSPGSREEAGSERSLLLGVQGTEQGQGQGLAGDPYLLPDGARGTGSAGGRMGRAGRTKSICAPVRPCVRASLCVRELVCVCARVCVCLRVCKRICVCLCVCKRGPLASSLPRLPPRPDRAERAPTLRLVLRKRRRLPRAAHGAEPGWEWGAGAGDPAAPQNPPAPHPPVWRWCEPMGAGGGGTG